MESSAQLMSIRLASLNEIFMIHEKEISGPMVSMTCVLLPDICFKISSIESLWIHSTFDDFSFLLDLRVVIHIADLCVIGKSLCAG